MPTVKTYKDYIRTHKQRNCPPYSKLKKGGLQQLAYKMGFVETGEKKTPVKKAPVKKAPVKKAPVKKTPVDRNNKVYEAMNEFLNSKSKRALNNIRKKAILNDDEINILLKAQRSMDFYPTPDKCLSVFDEDFDEAANLLEATAGTGSVVNYIKNKYPDVKVDANEFNSDLLPILKKYSGADRVMNKDFFNIKDFKKYDTVFINPPFSKGTNKKYYYDFLFYALGKINEAKGTSRRIYTLLFICPSIFENNKNTLFEDIVKKSSIKPFNRGLKLLGIKELTPKQFKDYKTGTVEYDTIETVFHTTQIDYLGNCDGFGGTNVKASMYRIMI